MIKIKFFNKIVFACACAWCLLLPFTALADTGTYYGTATITTPANLGTIDLAFNLDVNGSTIQPASSYIMLDKTLLFPKVAPQICTTTNNVTNCVDAGPRVSGAASATAFNLTTANLTQPPTCTDCFTSAAGTVTVTRKVALAGTKVTNSGNSIEGTYTETITGLGKSPVTVTGTFILVKPTVQTIVVALKDVNGDGCLDLNEIRSGGAYADSLEFNDISQALHLYYNPTASLKVCTKPSDLTGQQTIKNALGEYYATQKQQ